MKKIYVACLAIVLLFFTAPLFAQELQIDDEEMIVLADTESADPPAAGPAEKQPGPGAGWHHGFHEGQWGFLNLTGEQRAATRDIWRRYFAETHNLRYDLMAKRIEMAKLFTDPKADAAALTAKQKELAALREQLMDRKAQAIIQWRSLLTPEQVQKLDLMIMVHHKMSWRTHGAMGPGMMDRPMMGQPMMHPGWGTQGMHPGYGMHQGMHPGMHQGWGTPGGGQPETAPAAPPPAPAK